MFVPVSGKLMLLLILLLTNSPVSSDRPQVKSSAHWVKTVKPPILLFPKKLVFASSEDVLGFNPLNLVLSKW